MKLRETRCEFTVCLAQLILWAKEKGYEVSLEEVKRTKEEALANAEQGVGIASSLHILGLAGDLNLYKDGKWLQNSEDHRPLGDYWKSLHPLARWGGDFKDKRGRPKPDGNHYSFEWEGRK